MPKPKPPAPFLSEDSDACFQHFSKLLAANPPAALEPWNADAEIVRINVVRGVDAVRPSLDHVAKALPLVLVDDLLELPSLALALGFAANRVFSPASPGDIRARQESLRPTRSRTLRYLEVVGELGIVPAARVQSIRTGKGAIDEARDAVAIAALFTELAAPLAGKHPFTAAELKQLADDGNWLLQQLLPSGATPDKAEHSADMVTRDQLWTEVVRRYDELYQAGVAIWGRRGVNEHLPALQSRAIAPGPKAPPPPPAPAPPAGTPAP